MSFYPITYALCKDDENDGRDNSVYVTPQMFGAKADGVTDDTRSVKDALAACASEKKALYVPVGTYALSDNIDFSDVEVIGTSPEKCVFKMTAQAAAREHFIKCGGSVIVKNIQFKQSYGGAKFGMYECENSVIENCYFVVDEGISNNGYFDVCRSNNNIRIVNCKFINHSKQDAGGVWVRNGDNTVSRNIVFENCVFEHMTNDEIVAVWGWRGTIEEVTFRDCIFESLDSAHNPTHLITLGNTGVTKNVTLDNCVIRNNYAVQHTIKATASEDGVVENICIKNSKIYINGTANSSNYAFAASSEDTLTVACCRIVINSTQTVSFYTTFNDCYVEILQRNDGFVHAKVHNSIIKSAESFSLSKRSAQFTDCVIDYGGIANKNHVFHPLEANDAITLENCVFKNTNGFEDGARFFFTGVEGVVFKANNCKNIFGSFYSTQDNFTMVLTNNELTSAVTAFGNAWNKQIYNNFIDGVFKAEGLA